MVHFNRGTRTSKLLIFINSKNLRTIRKLIAYENFQDYSTILSGNTASWLNRREWTYQWLPVPAGPIAKPGCKSSVSTCIANSSGKRQLNAGGWRPGVLLTMPSCCCKLRRFGLPCMQPIASRRSWSVCYIDRCSLNKSNQIKPVGQHITLRILFAGSLFFLPSKSEINVTSNCGTHLTCGPVDAVSSSTVTRLGLLSSSTVRPLSCTAEKESLKGILFL